MEKKKSELTVNGVDYKEHIKNEEIKRRGEEAEKIFTEETFKQSRGIRPKSGPLQYPSPQGPAGYVRIIQDKEKLRKEIGIMAAPYKTMPENALWVALNGPPKTVREITQELGLEITDAKMAGVNSALKRVINRVPILEMVSETGRKPFRFVRSPEEPYKNMTVEEAYKLYLESGTKNRPGPKKKTEKLPIGIPGFFESKMEATIPQEIKVTVEVSGAINFLFGFKKS